MIKVSNLKKYYEKQLALQIENLQVNRGEVVVFCGPSGSGKTTALKTLNGLESIQQGEIKIDSKRLDDYSLPELATKIGFVAQKFNLFGHWSVLDNVIKPQMHVLGRTRSEACEIAMDNLNKVGMQQFISSLPDKLSGGQQQRVAIARSLAMQPEIVLFDEPTASLDPENVKSSLGLLTNLAKAGITMIVVTHELNFARKVSNRMVFFDKGGVLLEDTPTEVFFDQPKTERAHDFLNCLDLSKGV